MLSFLSPTITSTKTKNLWSSLAIFMDFFVLIIKAVPTEQVACTLRANLLDSTPNEPATNTKIRDKIVGSSANLLSYAQTRHLIYHPTGQRRAL